MRFIFLLFLLQSCGTPPQLSPYEQHKVDVQNFRSEGSSLESKSQYELLKIWETMYIEALLNNTKLNDRFKRG